MVSGTTIEPVLLILRLTAQSNQTSQDRHCPKLVCSAFYHRVSDRTRAWQIGPVGCPLASRCEAFNVSLALENALARDFQRTGTHRRHHVCAIINSSQSGHTFVALARSIANGALPQKRLGLGSIRSGLHRLLRWHGEGKHCFV